jgi:hypothetical protein
MPCDTSIRKTMRKAARQALCCMSWSHVCVSCNPFHSPCRGLLMLARTSSKLAKTIT